MLYYVIDAFAKCKFGVLDSKLELRGLSINYMTQFYQFSDPFPLRNASIPKGLCLNVMQRTTPSPTLEVLCNLWMTILKIADVQNFGRRIEIDESNEGQTDDQKWSSPQSKDQNFRTN